MDEQLKGVCDVGLAGFAAVDPRTFRSKHRINHAQAEAEHGETPMKVARSSAAWDVVQALLPYYT